MLFEFECAEHREFGGKGWRLKGHPNFEPLQGMAVAHDCMEHFPKDTGTIDQEFMALGASYVTREGESYYQHKGSMWSAAHNVASDMPRLLQGLLGGEYSLYPPPKTRRMQEDYEENFVIDVYNETISLMKSEFPDQDREADEKDQALIKDFMAGIVPWFRIGLRRAKRRYRSVPSFQLCHMFQTIEKEADKHLKHAEGYELLQVNMTGRDVTVRLHYPEDDYDDG